MKKICGNPVLFILFFAGYLFSTPFTFMNGWSANKNGSYHFKYQDLMLSNCYPAINGVAVHPLSVNIDRQQDEIQISYKLETGEIIIKLGQRKGMPVLSSQLIGIPKIPGWFHPLAAAKITGADRFYKQGFGFAGPSGVFSIPEPIKRMEEVTLKENVWSYDGYLFMGFIAPNDNAIVFSAFDHQNYLHKSTLYNKQGRFGLIDRHIGDNNIYFESGFSLEEVPFKGDTLVLPDIYISTGTKAFDTFQSQAKRLADHHQIKLNHKPAYYYCSWYEFNQEFTHEILMDMLEEIKESKIDPEFQTIQIDDGPAQYGDWLQFNKDRFPKGFNETVKQIRKHGYKAGIWVAPFMVTSKSDLYKNHKDWLLKDQKGDLLIGWQKEDETVYHLDSSHPDAFEYIREVFRTLREMGITAYKTDFMDWGYQDSRKVQRHTPGKTSAQYYNDVVRMIREEIGEESYWLGCISPFQGMVGYVDAIRTANDVGHTWSQYNVENMMREMVADQFFNNILWQNDPDVLYLRNYKMDLSDTEKYSIALFNGILGGVINTSCRFHTVPVEFQKLWKFIKPANQHYTAKLPFWSEPVTDRLIAVREYENTKDKAILVLNLSNQKIKIDYPLEEVCGVSKATLYQWLPEKSIKLQETSKLSVDLGSHESMFFYLSFSGNAPDKKSTLNRIQ